MIDINELRRLAQAALAGPDGISLNWIKLLQDFQQEANPTAISELLDRLEEARAAWKEADKACRDLTEKVIPNLRESLEAAEKDVALKEQVIDALGSELNAVANEHDTLRAKIADMEKQEPAALVKWQVGGLAVHIIGDVKAGDILYSLPGAQGEEK